jgi:SAM-dependent methyltransferase
MMPDRFDARLMRAAYDTVAKDYEAAFAGDLADLPVDLEVLHIAAARFPPALPVLDVGCGPGQVGARVAAHGVSVVALDLAPAMLAVAKRRNPERPLAAADMRALPVTTGSCGGVIAFYSVQHVARRELPAVLDEFHRVLVDGGLLVLATHLGEGEHIADEFLGHKIDTVGGTFYSRVELEGVITSSDFEIAEARERGPLPHEHQSQRFYVIARASPRVGGVSVR